ncbi:phosphate ABC transporter substrate-binding/OmpA family protein [Pseudogemmobacter humi]|uniref:Outer membrane porin F n=1 Tax=Pseudogemmobacter humi TaxID=2483812 RepID=A0A3P5X809_9RHOB|nr:phosphate ABC transporter substrate-binding/OmpA family protein [Pseudogemmobacter humi]VDC23494.1 Outer membrane porin F precursor [Pseudogemmobacter humi]
MYSGHSGAAVFAALVFAALLSALAPARAEDVTLISREGNIVLPGRLLGFDGEFYRIDTAWGLLTVDGQGVICEGPACPDLTAPRAEIRLTGAPDAGMRLMPGLFRAFAANRGLVFQETLPEAPQSWAARIQEPDGAQILADISFTPADPDTARAALDAGAAEFALTLIGSRGGEARPVALEALVPVMAPDNPTPRISTPDLARALSGEVKNWAGLGGPDMPIVLHALAPETDMARALAERLGTQIRADVLHPDMASLASAVAKDPWALAITGRAEMAPATAAPLTDSCGFPLLPLPVSVKAEDYPLALPVFLVPPPRRLPLIAREFLEFLATPQADTAVAAAGYIDRSVEAAPMTRDGLRLINAIRGAGADVTLADLKRLAEVMDGADRLSLTFRFEEGTSELDASSRENLAQLARLIGSGQFPAKALIFAGFSDGTGDAAANRALSSERAERVAQDLAALAPDLRPEQIPIVEGFGEALPMACDETAIGRRLNRRVELWVVPDFTPAPL